MTPDKFISLLRKEVSTYKKSQSDKLNKLK